MSLLLQAAAELSAPEASASPVIGEAGAPQAEPERKPPSVRHSSRVIGAFLSQVKDTAAKVRRQALLWTCLLP